MSIEVAMEVDGRALRPAEPHKWNTALRDELVSRARDPEHATCRVLVARGITGKVAFAHKKTGTTGLIVDIEKGDDLTVIEETNTGTPRVAKFSPFPSSVSLRASVWPADSETVPESAE